LVSVINATASFAAGVVNEAVSTATFDQVNAGING
jgi:hypothetical protein